MKKAEFLQELRETLAGEVSAAVIQENIAYYDSYISEQTASGRSEEAVLEEIGSPRLIARTIIDSQEAAQGTDGVWRESKEENRGFKERSAGESYGGGFGSFEQNREPKVHYIDFGKWYWKLLGGIALLLAAFLGFGLFTVVTGTVLLLIRFAGPLLVLWLIYCLIRGSRR